MSLILDFGKQRIFHLLPIWARLGQRGPKLAVDRSGPNLGTIVATVPPLQSTSNQQTRFSTFSSRERIRNAESMETPKPSPTPELPAKSFYTIKFQTNGTQN